jgi:hypothetical protein
MIAALIGLSGSLITILIFTLLKRIDKITVYSLILMGIAFLYIGYTWTNIEIAIMSFLQAVFFMVFAYYGLKKNLYFLIAGYFLHGVWDFMYSYVGNSDLIPPDYDWFCLTYDFVIGFYLIILNYQTNRNK